MAKGLSVDLNDANTLRYLLNKLRNEVEKAVSSLKSAIDGKLSKAGDDISGALKFRNGAYVYKYCSNIIARIGVSVPANNIYNSGEYVYDAENESIFYSEMAKTASDDLYRSYVIRRKSNDGNTLYYNGFYLHIDKDGNPSVTFNNTATRNAWRSALGIS